MGSKLITVAIEGDTEVFQKSLTDRADDYERFAADARMAGALHHRFGVGDGMIMVVDEWTDEDGFQSFFSRPELQTFIASVGGDMSVPPTVVITDAITSPDQF
jgi:hypothetical protein